MAGKVLISRDESIETLVVTRELIGALFINPQQLQELHIEYHPQTKMAKSITFHRR